MQARHWFAIIAFLVIGYLVGVKWPSYGQQALTAVGVS